MCASVSKPAPFSSRLLIALTLSFSPGAGVQPAAADDAHRHGPAENPSRPRVMLALSGGGTRGFAHIGVLRAFERCGVPIDGIAGTSIGAIIGGLYASGYGPAELEQVAVEQDLEDILFQPHPPAELPLSRKASDKWSLVTFELDRNGLRIPGGLVVTQRLTERLSLLMLRASGSTSFSHLRIPFRALAADLVTGRKVVLDSGSLVTALRASSAVPGIFAPVEIDGRLLVDGGVLDNLPVTDARELGGDIVVAVDVSSPLNQQSELRTFVDVVDQVIGFSMVQGVQRSRGLADVVITPAIGDHGTFEFSERSASDAIVCGEEAALAACPTLRRLVGSAAPPARPSDGRSPTHALRVTELSVRGARPATLAQVRMYFGALPANGELSLADLERRLVRVRSLYALKRVDLEYSGEAARLTLDVSEAAPTTVRIGARYDDKFDTLGKLAIIWRPGHGAIREVTLDGVIGSMRMARVGAYRERLLGSPLLAFARAMYLDDFDKIPRPVGDPGELRKHHAGFEAGVGWGFGMRGLLTTGYRLEEATSHVSEGGDPTLEEDIMIGALVLRGELDTSERTEYPHSGTALSLSAIFAQPGFGGDVNYTLVDGEARGWLPISDRSVFYGRGRVAGTISGSLPEIERLVAGGNDPLPGYARDRFRGETLGVGTIGVRQEMFRLPAAAGGGIYLSLEAAGGTVSDGRAEFSDGDKLLFGAALRAACETRLGPFELVLGINRDGRAELTFDAGPRF